MNREDRNNRLYFSYQVKFINCKINYKVNKIKKIKLYNIQYQIGHLNIKICVNNINKEYN